MSIPWTPELERARIELCEALLMYAHERVDVPRSLKRRLIEAEQALTILGDIANAKQDTRQ